MTRGIYIYISFMLGPTENYARIQIFSGGNITRHDIQFLKKAGNILIVKFTLEDRKIGVGWNGNG